MICYEVVLDGDVGAGHNNCNTLLCRTLNFADIRNIV